MTQATIPAQEALGRPVLRLDYHSAARLHQALERLYLLTSKRAVSKVRARRESVFMERVFVAAAADYYKQLGASMAAARSLISRARKLRARYPENVRDTKDIKDGIKTGLAASLFSRMGEVEPTKLKRAGALAARTALYQTADVLGFKPKLDPKWDNNPEEAFEETFPLEAAEEKQRHSMLPGLFAETAATAIVQNAFKKVPAAEAANMLQVKLNANLRFRSKLTGRNEANKVGNGVTNRVMTDSGVKQRRNITVEDAKVCVDCLGDAAAGWIGLKEPYPSGAMVAGDQHNNCRCYEEYRTLPACGDVPDDALAKAIENVTQTFQKEEACTRPPSYMRPQESSPMGTKPTPRLTTTGKPDKRFGQKSPYKLQPPAPTQPPIPQWGGSLDDIPANLSAAEQTEVRQTFIRDRFEIDPGMGRAAEEAAIAIQVIPAHQLSNVKGVVFSQSKLDAFVASGVNITGGAGRPGAIADIWKSKKILVGGRASKDTIVHEVGHFVMHKKGGLQDKFIKIFQANKKSGTGFPTEYAKVDFKELFADSYRMYLTNPAALRVKNRPIFDIVEKLVNPKIKLPTTPSASIARIPSRRPIYAKPPPPTSPTPKWTLDNIPDNLPVAEQAKVREAWWKARVEVSPAQRDVAFNAKKSLEHIPVHHLEKVKQAYISQKRLVERVGPHRKAGGICSAREQKIWIGGHPKADVLTHEVGHMTQTYKVSAETNKYVTKLYNRATREGTGFPTEYAKKNPRELFADSYRLYFQDPQMLKIKSRDMFDVIDSVVKPKGVVTPPPFVPKPSVRVVTSPSRIRVGGKIDRRFKPKLPIEQPPPVPALQPPPTTVPGVQPRTTVSGKPDKRFKPKPTKEVPTSVLVPSPFVPKPPAPSVFKPRPKPSRTTVSGKPDKRFKPKPKPTAEVPTGPRTVSGRPDRRFKPKPAADVPRPKLPVEAPVAPGPELVETRVADFEKRFRAKKVEHGGVLDNKGNVLFERRGTKDYIQFTYEEQKLLKNAEVFIHNHPTSMTFSLEDVGLAAGNNIKKIVVISDKYRYTATSMNPTWTSGKIIGEEWRAAKEALFPSAKAVFIAEGQLAADTWLNHEIWRRIASKIEMNYTREAL